jgi:hypothetical protein
VCTSLFYEMHKMKAKWRDSFSPLFCTVFSHSVLPSVDLYFIYEKLLDEFRLNLVSVVYIKKLLGEFHFCPYGSGTTSTSFEAQIEIYRQKNVNHTTEFNLSNILGLITFKIVFKTVSRDV